MTVLLEFLNIEGALSPLCYVNMGNNLLQTHLLYYTLVDQLSEKIVHFLIKASNLVQHLVNSYYFILETVPLKLLNVSCSKNLKSKINRKCIGKAIKVL